MTKQEDDPEIEHALGLIREVEGWDGMYTLVPVDHVCRFGNEGEECNKPLHDAVVLRHEDEVSLLLLCEHHSGVMERALEHWRGIN
jgi:hypothetical protein